MGLDVRDLMWVWIELTVTHELSAEAWDAYLDIVESVSEEINFMDEIYRD